MSRQEKVMTMKEAIGRYVADGDTIYMAGFLSNEPYAATHEIIRQKKRNLTLSKLAGILIGDMLIGAGCVDKLITSYVWNPGPKPAHAFKRALEQGIPREIEMADHTVLALSLAYFAGALDLPYVAAKTLMGSDIAAESFAGDMYKVVDSPFTGEKVCLIRPLKHDVGIIQVQRVDAEGNSQAWGIMGENIYGINSCKKVIVCAEEIVDTAVIRSDPNKTTIPAFRVSAVVEEPWGAHPAYMKGCYKDDWEYYLYYDQATKTVEKFEQYLDEWVYGTKDRRDYLARLGEERLSRLRSS